MTTTAAHLKRGFLLSLLTLLTLLGAFLVSPVDASASTRDAAETRVRAIDHPAAALVELVDPAPPTGVGVSGDHLRQVVSATRVVTNSASDVLLNSSKQLQAKFKHASDFGVAGDYSKANATNFSRALNQHINSSSVTKIAGTYRGNPVTHYLDPATGLNVIVDHSGALISGWRLGPAQLQNVLTYGGLT